MSLPPKPPRLKLPQPRPPRPLSSPPARLKRSLLPPNSPGLPPPKRQRRLPLRRRPRWKRRPSPLSRRHRLSACSPELARLPLDPETERVKQRFFELTRATLLRADLPRQPDTDLAAHDVVAIVKGMIDAAGEHGEEDRQGLTERVRRAVIGYLATAPDAG